MKVQVNSESEKESLQLKNTVTSWWVSVCCNWMWLQWDSKSVYSMSLNLFPSNTDLSHHLNTNMLQIHVHRLGDTQGATRENYSPIDTNNTLKRCLLK